MNSNKKIWKLDFYFLGANGTVSSQKAAKERLFGALSARLFGYEEE